MDAAIKKALLTGQDIKALTQLLDECNRRLAESQGWKAWTFSESKVSVMVNRPDRFYSSFTIPKKSGGERRIDAPRKRLKMIQMSLAPLFSDMFDVSPMACGFVKGRGIVQNAELHLNRAYVLNVDIKGFFPSITTGRLISLFRTNKVAPMSHYMARSTARLCTLDGRLPQGSPASPVLTNLVCVRLDARLAGLARRYGCTYSRYVDDMTFSADRRGALEKLLPHLHSILAREGFGVNPDKTRLQTTSMRQEVTGLVISHSHSDVEPQVNTLRRSRREVRAALHRWRRDGLEEAAIGGHFRGDETAFVHHMRGRVAHMLHVAKTPEVLRLDAELRLLIQRDVA